MECKGIEFQRFFWNVLLVVEIVKSIRWVNLVEKHAKLVILAKSRRNPTEVQGKFWTKWRVALKLSKFWQEPPIGREQKLKS